MMLPALRQAPSGLHPCRTARSSMQPDGQTVEGEATEGPTFSFSIKLLATFLVGAIALGGFSVADRVYAAGLSASAMFFMLAAVGVTVVCYYRMLRSRTSIDAVHIRQDYFWPKEVALADIIQARFICVPRLTWLIAPRLLVRVRGSVAFWVFYAGDRCLQKAFTR